MVQDSIPPQLRAVRRRIGYSLVSASRSTGEQREDAVKARDAVAERLTPEGRSEAQRRAREWDAAHPREP